MIFVIHSLMNPALLKDISGKVLTELPDMISQAHSRDILLCHPLLDMLSPLELYIH